MNVNIVSKIILNCYFTTISSKPAKGCKGGSVHSWPIRCLVHLAFIQNFNVGYTFIAFCEWKNKTIKERSHPQYRNVRLPFITFGKDSRMQTLQNSSCIFEQSMRTNMDKNNHEIPRLIFLMPTRFLLILMDFLYDCTIWHLLSLIK